MPVARMRHFRPNYLKLSVLAALTAAVLSGTGCISKLKARDNLNQGVNAFKSGNYAEAADRFKTAIALDPTFDTARLYLATAYVQQYIPGTETPENKKFATAAMDEFQSVLNAHPDDASKLLATESVASLYYNTKQPDKAIEWNKKVIALDPKNKEAYYTLGVIPWQQFIGPDREERLNEKMRPEDPPPLKDAKGRQALKDKYWQSLTDAIEDERKALAIDPQYDNALSYMNLLIRYRADLDDSKEQAAADTKEADDWLNKALEAQKANAKKKAEAQGH